MMVTREDVLKYLKALDDNRVQNRDFNGNVIAGKSVKLREEYCNVFLDMFGDIDIKIWETTTRLVVERKKPWATPDEMVSYVATVEAAFRKKQESIAESEPMLAPEKEFSEAFSSERLKKSRKERMDDMFALARQGKFKEASSLIGSRDRRNKAMEYGKAMFPDADAEWYEENIFVLQALLHQQETCNYCNGTGACKTKGYRQAGFVDKETGVLSVVMKPCMLKKVESTENVSL